MATKKHDTGHAAHDDPSYMGASEISKGHPGEVYKPHAIEEGEAGYDVQEAQREFEQRTTGGTGFLGYPPDLTHPSERQTAAGKLADAQATRRDAEDVQAQATIAASEQPASEPQGDGEGSDEGSDAGSDSSTETGSSTPPAVPGA